MWLGMMTKASRVTSRRISSDLYHSQVDNVPHPIQHHFPVHYLTEQVLSPIGADRDEERRIGGVIKPLQARGFAALPHRKTSPGFIRSALKSGSSEANITTSRLIAETHRKSEGRISTGSRVRK